MQEVKVRMSKPVRFRCKGDCEHCIFYLECHPDEIDDYKAFKEVSYEGDY